MEFNQTKAAEEFKELQRIMKVPQLPKPTDEQVAETIAKINERLTEKPINRNANLAVKEGYTHAVYILENRITDITKSFIGDLKTVQGRAIAGCAMDYLIGKCSQETLVNVPIKRI